MTATAQPAGTIDEIPADLRRDVMLPVLDGFSVVERMKADLVARLGVDAYVHKPFDTDELLRRVRRLVGATARI